MKYSLPSFFRLKTKKQIREIFHDAERISSDYFLLFLKANTLSYPRLAIIISKRSVRNAVDRNRFKRVVKESFRLHQHLISGYDVLIIASKNIAQLNNKELFRCLKKQWLQLHKHQKKA
jgi:ribonuclease P protein component